MASNIYAPVDDVLATGIYMHEPVTAHEAERVLHALYLANYKVEKLPPEQGKVRPREPDVSDIEEGSEFDGPVCI
jgi:hypothetical protein